MGRTDSRFPTTPFPRSPTCRSTPFPAMWWMCNLQFCRNNLRLRLWARDELEARAKVQRMYQVATIQNLSRLESSPLPAEDRRASASAGH